MGRKAAEKAEECRLIISNLATNLEERETFTRLAETIDRRAEDRVAYRLGSSARDEMENPAGAGFQTPLY
jgi:hypothetical protein